MYNLEDQEEIKGSDTKCYSVNSQW
jgi:hypothetical protein